MAMRPHIALAALLPLILPACRTIEGLASTVSQNFVTPRPAAAREPASLADSSGVSVTWIGHSTVLLRMHDRFVLTDPFFTNHVAQLKMRLVEPGLAVDLLPGCDIVLLSHSHADHTNLGSLGRLERKFPSAHLVFPEGLEEFLPDYSFRFHRLAKADPARGIWTGGTVDINGVSVTAVGAFHWGGRYGLDGTLWGYDAYTGYVFRYGGVTVYYSGDTGYDSTYFRRLGEMFAIDLAILPIGPTYEPRGLGNRVHVYAAGALKVFEDLRAPVMVPVHFETTHEPFDSISPREALADLLAERPPEGRVAILRIGEQITLFSEPAPQR
jgi:L-ascorbate metabolism protein UlaG (beta-lactamase superfamily)